MIQVAAQRNRDQDHRRHDDEPTAGPGPRRAACGSLQESRRGSRRHGLLEKNERQRGRSPIPSGYRKTAPRGKARGPAERGGREELGIRDWEEGAAGDVSGVGSGLGSYLAAGKIAITETSQVSLSRNKLMRRFWFRSPASEPAKSRHTPLPSHPLPWSPSCTCNLFSPARPSRPRCGP